MFACNYVLHAGHHDILAFSVSYMSIKIKFCHEETITWRNFPHPVWLLHTLIYMFAYILFNPNHIHVTCETCKVKISWNGTFLRHPRAQMAPHYFSNPPTHTNSPYIIVSPCISIHLDTLPKLNPPKLAGKTFSCPPLSQLSPKSFSSLPLLTLW